MPEIDGVSEGNLFEVILYFENNSWAFSTCTYSAHSKEALELAEREFSIHALHHKLGNIKANSAYVLDRLEDHYFCKRDGKWQIESDRFGPFSPSLFPAAAEVRAGAERA